MTDIEDSVPLRQLLDMAGPGEYLANMAYVSQTPGLDQARDDLRRRVTESYGIATTMGYGHRFLQSTGQLHKGGPGSGLFLQLTADHAEDLAIPGAPFTFGVLVDARALGDLQALRASGRRAVRVDVGPNPEEAIRRIADEVG